ncbi:MAG: carbohydrate binding family 9 domain-containing protein [Opitutae bacterium]|nr:carbohydrate binding family 9 domain-containing protein [Opitutae bacterium]
MSYPSARAALWRSLLPWRSLLWATVFVVTSVAGAGPAAVRPKRVYQATRLTGAAPVIDGRLDDAAWAEAGEWAGHFTQFAPQHGGSPSHATELKILFDERHLYVAMRAYDDPVNQRSRQAGDRDVFAGDIMGIDFDSYHDQRTGFEFNLTASGQKIDLRLANNSWDTTWNAVWEGKVAHEADCWTAEFLIPLSQLRYDPRNPVWGLHAWRWIDRLKEESDWQLLVNDDSGFVKSFGELRGLTGLRPARRIEVLPFGSVRTETGAGGATRTEFQAGLDAKIGLTSNVTLDASLLPDFGQVEADPAVMNLTAFETFLTEKRPLFLEGKEIFDFPFNDDTLFYSRRIGQAPSYFPPGAVEAMPEASTLLGAVKVSGKTGRGLSFGLLTAVTDREEVAVDDALDHRRVDVAPRAAQLVLRAQQDFRHGDTVVGGIVTHVRRDMPSDELAAEMADRATAAGVDLVHYWADREYFLSASAVGSEVRGDPRAISRLQLSSARFYQRPIAGRSAYDPRRENLAGTGLWLKAGKASKGHWRWSEELTAKSPGLELNDLGYLAQADQLRQGTAVAYIERTPAAWYRSYELKLAQNNAWTTRSEFLGSGLELNASAEFANKWGAYVRVGGNGAGRDPVALRGGPLLRVPANWNWSGSLNTDGSRRVSGEVYAQGAQARYDASSSTGYGGKISVRPVPTLQLSLAADANTQTDRQRYLPLTSVNGAADGWFVSQIEGESRSLALRAEWNIRPEFSVQYYGNPFGSTVRFAEFRRVLAPGADDHAQRYGGVLPASLAGGLYAFDENGDGLTDYELGDPDGNWASFHSNLVFKWEYRRGSMLYFVWAQQREGAAAGKDEDAWSTLGGLRQRPASNQFMVKWTYWFSS